MSITWTNITRIGNTAWTNINRTLSGESILQEDGFYLLLETGGRIILEQSVQSPVVWTNQIKS